MASKGKLDPLREFLDAVVTRIENLETHCGIAPAAGASSGSSSGGTSALEKSPSVRHLAVSGKVTSHDIGLVLSTVSQILCGHLNVLLFLFLLLLLLLLLFSLLYLLVLPF